MTEYLLADLFLPNAMLLMSLSLVVTINQFLIPQTMDRALKIERSVKPPTQLE